MKNKWKIGFLTLLGIILLLAIIIISLILNPSADEQNIDTKELEGEHVSFHVQSNKNDLNKLINHYLQEEALNSPIEYQVLLDEEVELYGTIPVFSEEIKMKLTFEPEALENGDLMLRQKSMSLGSLPVPVSYVLKFIGQNYQLPKGVEIRPDDQLIYVHMQQIALKSDTKIKVDKFDLKNDQIGFTILVPVK